MGRRKGIIGEQKMKENKLSPLEKFTIDNCWDLRFFDKAGNADVAMAKKAFEWCKEEYPEWFSEETPFVLEHNRISWNSDEYSDDVDYSEIPSASPDSWCDCSPEEWLQQVGDGIDAKIIIAEFIKNDMEEEAESYYKSAVYENGKVTVIDKFNFNGASALRLEEYGGNDCDTPGYALNPRTFKDYKGKFRNKKTGEEKLSGSVTGSVYEDEDGDVFWKMEFELNGEKSFVYDFSDYFVDTLDKFIEESYHFDKDFADNLISNFADEEGLDEDGWEFAGFDSEPSIFESYFGNQADDYEEGLDEEDLDEENLDDDYEDESDDCDSEEIKLENISKKDFVFVKGTGKGYDKINDFYICKYPVTQALYEKITGENPSAFKGPNRPVESLLAEDAVMFCNLLSKKMGLKPCFSLSAKCNFEASGFRLPTWEEWKWAAKGGVKSKGYKYAGSNKSEEVAVFGEDETSDVGTLKPNELGLYDMSGNVAEMCFDESLNRVCNPSGGCYCYSEEDCEIEAEDNPFYDDDEEEEESKLADWIGFRLVCNGKDFCDTGDEDEEKVVVEKKVEKKVVEKKSEKAKPSVKAKTKYQPTDLSAFEIEGDVLKKVLTRNHCDIVIPEGIKTIGKSSCGSYSYIQSIILPDGLTTIENKGLFGSMISTITLPASLAKLEENAISGIYLTEIRYEGTIEDWYRKVEKHKYWLDSSNSVPSIICYDGRADCYKYDPNYDAVKEAASLKKENPDQAALLEILSTYPEAYLKYIEDEDTGENEYVRINLPIGNDNGVELMMKIKTTKKWIKDLPEFVSLAKQGSYKEFRKLMAEKNYVDSTGYYVEIEDGKLVGVWFKPRYLIIPDEVTRIIGKTDQKREVISLEIPETVPAIGNEAFKYFHALRTVILFKGLKSIGDHAFEGCVNLKNIIFNGTMSEWNQIEKAKHWTGEGEDLIAASVVHCSDGDVEI